MGRTFLAMTTDAIAEPPGTVCPPPPPPLQVLPPDEPPCATEGAAGAVMLNGSRSSEEVDKREISGVGGNWPTPTPEPAEVAAPLSKSSRLRSDEATRPNLAPKLAAEDADGGGRGFSHMAHLEELVHTHTRD